MFITKVPNRGIPVVLGHEHHDGILDNVGQIVHDEPVVALRFGWQTAAIGGQSGIHFCNGRRELSIAAFDMMDGSLTGLLRALELLGGPWIDLMVDVCVLSVDHSRDVC